MIAKATKLGSCDTNSCWEKNSDYFFRAACVTDWITSYLISTCRKCLAQGGGGGGTLDFKWQGWWKDFLGGVRFSLSGFFWIGKFWQVFFLGIQNQCFYSSCYITSCFLEIFMTGDLAWNFLGVKFWSRDILRFVWSPRDFLGFWFLPPFDHPCHLKFGVPTWGINSNAQFYEPNRTEFHFTWCLS